MSTDEQKKDEVIELTDVFRDDKRSDKKGKVLFDHLVYGPEFVLDSIEIKKKDVLDYIKGKSFLLGDDYYYGYVYKDGRLGFIALKTEEYTAGSIAVMALPLLFEGDYYYTPDDTGLVYMFSHHHGVIKSEVGHSVKPDYKDLRSLVMPEYKDLPKTLYLTWALKEKISKASIIYAAIFAGALLFLAIASTKYSTISSKVAAAKPKTAVVTETGKKRIEIAKTVAKVGALVDGKGVINKVSVVKDQLEFNIHFNNPNDAEAFVVLNGGRYENGQVVFTATSANRL